ncbi:MAG: hypothetical protein GY865_02530 [candidate division Zixibacteria bacterium]|nr:hypothetical protein [candidate division Zixibacteria bacterium]
MTISGFTIIRNATKFHFPIKESIESILPIVDEFIVALGDCDADDTTRQQIESIGSSKIIIFDRPWDKKLFIDGHIFRDETTFALNQCKGDWCFYLQADEVVHENDLETIKQACNIYIDDTEVEGMLFNYNHFWGDYDHYLYHHGWYQKEIRIVRNNIGVESFCDAQSFRIKNTQKLNVIQLPSFIYHYGWVRPPQLMIEKKEEQDSMHHGVNEKEQKEETKEVYDYGPLGRLPVFDGTHPNVMNQLLKEISWIQHLDYGKKLNLSRPLNKHEKLKYRFFTYIEQKLNGGRHLFGYSNWNLLRNK